MLAGFQLRQSYLSHSSRTRETLDIKISDELGERSYELYSGGESFRVDFAVRIALSQLLARRAGTRLRTLIIDDRLQPGRQIAAWYVLRVPATL